MGREMVHTEYDASSQEIMRWRVGNEALAAHIEKLILIIMIYESLGYINCKKKCQSEELSTDRLWQLADRIYGVIEITQRERG